MHKKHMLRNVDAAEARQPASEASAPGSGYRAGRICLTQRDIMEAINTLSQESTGGWRSAASGERCGGDRFLALVPHPGGVLD